MGGDRVHDGDVAEFVHGIDAFRIATAPGNVENHAHAVGKMQLAEELHRRGHLALVREHCDVVVAGSEIRRWLLPLPALKKVREKGQTVHAAGQRENAGLRGCRDDGHAEDRAGGVLDWMMHRQQSYRDRSQNSVSPRCRRRDGNQRTPQVLMGPDRRPRRVFALLSSDLVNKKHRIVPSCEVNVADRVNGDSTVFGVVLEVSKGLEMDFWFGF